LQTKNLCPKTTGKNTGRRARQLVRGYTYSLYGSPRRCGPAGALRWTAVSVVQMSLKRRTDKGGKTPSRTRKGKRALVALDLGFNPTRRTTTHLSLWDMDRRVEEDDSREEQKNKEEDLLKWATPQDAY